MLGAQLLARALVARPGSSNRKIQVMGAVSLGVACKVTEQYSPTLDEIGDTEYTNAELVAEEKELCSLLGFRVGGPTPIDFLVRYQSLSSDRVYEGARCLCFISTYVPECYACTPDVVADTCLTKESLEDVSQIRFRVLPFTQNQLRKIVHNPHRLHHKIENGAHECLNK